jgi:hypothetical protein
MVDHVITKQHTIVGALKAKQLSQMLLEEQQSTAQATELLSRVPLTSNHHTQGHIIGFHDHKTEQALRKQNSCP